MYLLKKSVYIIILVLILLLFSKFYFEYREKSGDDKLITRDPVAKSFDKINIQNDKLLQIIDMLHNGSIEQKIEAANILSTDGSTNAVTELLNELEKDNDPDVRLAILTAISKFNSEDSIDLLISRLGDSNKFDLRQAAQKSLTQNTSSTTVRKLLEAVRSTNGDLWIIKDVAKIFQGYTDPQMIAPLEKGLLSAENRTETELCAEALANIGNIAAGNVLFTAALKTSGDNRKAIIFALSHISNKITLNELSTRNFTAETLDIRDAILLAQKKFR
ncbi:MAG: HEAT repeat domain-containing protein [Candidatus Paceibacterota bacterium]|jgi:HEAT repeat protein